jgi:hypothetical protein
MAELSKIRKNGVDYDIKDAVARKAIENLEIPEGGTVTPEQIASAVEDYFAENPVTGGGLTTAQINALDNLFKVCAFTKADVSAEYNAFCTAFGIEGGITPDEPDIPDVPDEPDEPTVNLTSISATYSGGNVPVGTAVTALTGIVVTAHYSDGSQRNVTGYTLSGTIAEGSNTVTVTYQGKNTTFVVNGVNESGGAGDEIPLTWVDGYAITGGKLTENASWSASELVDCTNISKIRVASVGATNYISKPNVYAYASNDETETGKQISNNEGQNYLWPVGHSNGVNSVTFDLSGYNYFRLTQETYNKNRYKVTKEA